MIPSLLFISIGIIVLYNSFSRISSKINLLSGFKGYVF